MRCSLKGFMKGTQDEIIKSRVNEHFKVNERQILVEEKTEEDIAMILTGVTQYILAACMSSYSDWKYCHHYQMSVSQCVQQL